MMRGAALWIAGALLLAGCGDAVAPKAAPQRPVRVERTISARRKRRVSSLL